MSLTAIHLGMSRRQVLSIRTNVKHDPSLGYFEKSATKAYTDNIAYHFDSKKRRLFLLSYDRTYHNIQNVNEQLNQIRDHYNDLLGECGLLRGGDNKEYYYWIADESFISLAINQEANTINILADKKSGLMYYEVIQAYSGDH